jgi:hypothetical protein
VETSFSVIATIRVATLTSMTVLDIMENGELKIKGHLEDEQISGDLTL